MISYEIKINDNKEKQELLNIQGMDILFILKNFPTEILNKYLENNFMKVLRKIEKQINNSTQENRQLLLAKSHQFDVATCSQFKVFIDLLIKQNILYNRGKLLSIPEEKFEQEIERIERQFAGSINHQHINPYYEYQLNFCRFAKYVMTQIAYCNYIVGVLDSGLANEKKALQELKKVKTQLQTMGYEFKDSNKQANLSNNKKKKVLFFCDIMGTIDYSEEQDYEDLAQKLQLLKDKNGADEIVFSLITGDESRSYLLDYVNAITPYLEQYDVEIGKQFMEDSYYYHDEFIRYSRNSKIAKIIDYTNELKEESDIVSVYYVDDRPTYFNENIKEALGETYYCCLGIESESKCEHNFTASSERNIQGVLQAIDFHIDPEKINQIKTLKLTMQQEEDPDEDDDNDLPF